MGKRERLSSIPRPTEDMDVARNGNLAPRESIIATFFHTNLNVFVLIISPITLLISASLGHKGLSFVTLTPLRIGV